MSETPIHVPETSSKKEQFLYYNTLACLVKAIEGCYTVIDLRNESSIAGKIVRVDGYMNVEMEEIVYFDSRGIKHYFSQFFLRHRNIRYVHIPKEFSSMELIQGQLSGMRRVKPSKKRNFKQVRAQRYQKEIVQSINK